MTSSRRLASGHFQMVFAALNALGFWFAFAASAASPGIPLRDATQVNDPFQGILVRGEPILRAAANGQHAVLWRDVPTISHTLFHRTLSPSGALASPAVAVAGADSSTASADRLAVNADGFAVVVWVSSGGSTGTGKSVYAQRLGANGEMLDDRPILVADEPGDSGVTLGTVSAPAVAIDDSGQFIVAWHQRQNVGIYSLPAISLGFQRIMARRYRADGTPLGDAHAVSGLPFKSLTGDIRMAASGTGDFVIAYRLDQQLPVEDARALQFPYEGRFYAAGGGERGVPFQFVAGFQRQRAQGHADFAVTFTASGDLMLAWTGLDQRFAATEETVLMRRFSPAGLPLADTVTVAKRGPRFFETTLSLAPLPAGGVAIAWPDRIGNATGTAYGRYYAADDSPLTDPFVIATDVRTVSADTDGAGNLIAVYGETDIYARVFQGP